MKNLGHSDLIAYNEVENPIVPDAEAVQRWIIVAPQEAYVRPRARAEGVVLEHS